MDALRYATSRDLVERHQQGGLPLEAMLALMSIVNRFERAADQAKNICQEVVYMCTGEYTRHQGNEVYRVLFVDERNACRGQMAEGIGNSLGQSKFIFSSAGLMPEPLDARTAAFMEANYRFRDAWTALVPNKRLVRAIQLYADHVRYLRAFTLDEGPVRAVVLKGLKRLALALAAGDGEGAAAAMRAHLENAKQILLEKTERS